MRQKRLERKGVNALFSLDKEGRRPGLLVGNIAIITGLALWAIDIAGAQHPSYLGPSGPDPYVSLVLAPLGLLFVVCGAAASLTLRARPTPATNEEPSDDAVGRAQLPPLSRQISTASVRLGIVAFFESVLIITLYAGVLDEYRSNFIMQDWVHRSLPTAQVFLSFEALMTVSGILALLIAQFLPGRRFHRKMA